MSGKNSKSRLNKDTLNLVIAVCAVLISAASFYAAYVQSEAAQKQVQAETWPYLQLDHGNYDEEQMLRDVYVKVINSGVGPAKVKSLNLFYKGKPINGFAELYVACCLSEEEKNGAKILGIANAITGNPPPTILLPRDELLFFSALENDQNKAAWARLDKARLHISGEACYCSLLNECFTTDFTEDPVPTNICKPARSGR